MTKTLGILEWGCSKRCDTDCSFEQVEISQALDRALGPSIENSFPGVLGCVPTFSLDKGPTQSVCEQQQ